MYIYLTTNIKNGSKYIGQSTLESNKSKRYLGSGTILQHAIKKHGTENFTKEILVDNVESKELLDLLEMQCIEYFKPEYNITAGGDGGPTMVGRNHSEETKLKMSLVKRGLIPSENQRVKSRVPWNKGIKTGPLTEEHKSKISNSNKGQSPSKEHRENLSKALIGKNKGRIRPEEEKRKISKGLKKAYEEGRR
jgi:group I intron endonuclease